MASSIHRLRLIGTGMTEAGAPVRDPISAIESDHALQLELCDVLEYIADALPDDADRALAAVAVAILRKGFPNHMALEERHLFPMLRFRGAGDPSLEPTLYQLEQEHESDESYAQEIAEELAFLASEGQVRNPDMLGFMLRGFFESQRRHIKWENTLVLPLARRILTDDDLNQLRDAMASSSNDDDSGDGADNGEPDPNGSLA